MSESVELGSTTRVEQIVEFLGRCRWSPQEIAYVRPHLHRWERHLRNMGVAVIPSASAYWSEEEDRSHDHLFHLMMNGGTAPRNGSSINSATSAASGHRRPNRRRLRWDSNVVGGENQPQGQHPAGLQHGHRQSHQPAPR